jgi:hypothetical protein
LGSKIGIHFPAVSPGNVAFLIFWARGCGNTVKKQKPSAPVFGCGRRHHRKIQSEALPWKAYLGGLQNVPEPIDGLPIGLRLICNHLPDCPQSERESGIAAALECRLDRWGMDELAYSPNRYAGNEMMSGWYVFPQNILRRPDGSFNYAIRVHDRSNARGTRAFQPACDSSLFDAPYLNIYAVANLATDNPSQQLIARVLLPRSQLRHTIALCG